MVGRLFLIYAVVELMVTIGLAAAIGVGWTVAVLVGTLVLGLGLGAPMGGFQLTRQFMQLRSGVQEPRNALSDGALTAMATGLVVIPGLATTVLGLLLLVPPIRAVARPSLTAVAMRGFLRRVPLIGATPPGVPRQDYIDGEVIDVIDGEPPTLTRAPGTAQPPR
ncbi:FxsA family protein [Mycobacterium camsae]|uniref:FxsA family protein n=1 Tax=Mycobacterium gordonae TaxID=1778 RepID=UPI001981B039|nr:FxsA family protein [Mycobacterium gordonae]